MPQKRPRRRLLQAAAVDSWSTVLDNDDITDLIFVRGIDLVPSAPTRAILADEVEARPA